eukprot:TRINITY_DN1658_c0_g1_i5.p1 TRINITY_DN1658_c0_g1~~TRINITY_DN1658_c0_g1_i5.p1  ORF type:complete len:234 (+),score=14.76 TRINITY_DN1658_c0_g1_i5:288-989(+)
MSKPVVLNFVPIGIENVTPNDIECKYFDERTQTWATDGCQVTAATASSISCSCTHFTEFSVFKKQQIPPQLNSGNSVPRIKDSPSNEGFSFIKSAAFYLLIGLIVMAVFFAFYAIGADSNGSGSNERPRSNRLASSRNRSRQQMSFFSVIWYILKIENALLSIILLFNTNFPRIFRTFVLFLRLLSEYFCSLACISINYNLLVWHQVLLGAACCAVVVPFAKVLNFIFTKRFL